MTVLHGDYPLFRALAPRIAAAVGPCDLPIFTQGALHLPPPERYAFYNTEPLHVPSKWARLHTWLRRADRVFDYSTPNLLIYPRAEFRPIQLGPVPAPHDPTDCDIDILFYGLATPRRQAILDRLPVTVIDRCYGADLHAVIQRSRLVLCVNAYDDLNGNPLRAFPALEYGARLVAERTREAWYNLTVADHAPVVPYRDVVATCLDLLEAAA